jgi:O-antigen/teichoic acid export membrane protein
VPSLSRTVFRNSAFGMGSQLAIKVLSFAFSVLVVRHLGAAEYGQYAAVLAFGAIFVFLADLGLSPYAVRDIAQRRGLPGGEEAISALYGNLLALRVLLSLATSVLLVGAAWLTGRPAVMVGAIALGAAGLVINSAFGASEAVAAGAERLDVSATARVLNQLTFVVLGAAALWLGLGYYGLIFANLAAIVAMTWLCWRAVRRLGIRPTRATISCWPSLLRASLPFGVIGIALGLSYRFDSVLLSVFRSDVETGYYNAAYNLVFSATVLSNAINTALYPSLARDAATSPDALVRTGERALRYLMVIALPIAAGIWAVADQMVPLLFTSAYLPAAAVLRVVIWAVPLMFASEFLGYLVLIRGSEGAAARSVAISTALNVGLNLLLVPTYGLTAAAAMTVATELVLVVQYLWLLRAELRQIDLGRAIGRPLAAALIMGGLALALRDLPLVAVAALGALTYAGLLLVLGVAGRDELRFLLSLRRPVPVAHSA